MDWFKVGKQGLAKQLKRNGMAFVVRELWSNALDADSVHEVSVTLKLDHGQHYELVVSDDSPSGFQQLSDAFTLFAESTRKKDATKRGRFGLGEKLVLAACDEAEIRTTTGAVLFDAKGRHNCPARKTASGSIFRGVLKLSKQDVETVKRQVRQYIVPDKLSATFNCQPLAHREPIGGLTISLPTELADDDGVIHPTVRKAVVQVYEPLPGYPTALYELGVPVTETLDRWDVDVRQKIPLTLDRENVRPSYLREIRAQVLNLMHERITPEDANATWVREASSSEKCSPEAIKTVVVKRFGEKATIADPSDHEATNALAYKGYTIVSGNMLNKTEWENVRKAEALKPAGQILPTPKPFSPGGKPLKIVEPKDWDDTIKYAVAYAKNFARWTIDEEITVVVANDRGWEFSGCYAKDEHRLIMNLAHIRPMIKDGRPVTITDKMTTDNWERYDAFLIHELGHEYGDDHRSEEYHRGLCKIGAKARRYARNILDFSLASAGA